MTSTRLIVPLILPKSVIRSECLSLNDNQAFLETCPTMVLPNAVPRKTQE